MPSQDAALHEPVLLDGHPDVVLRPPVAGDVDALVTAAQDPDVQYFARVPFPYTRADAEDFIAFIETVHAARTGLFRAVILRGELVGMASVGIDRRDDTGEVGYWMAPPGRGRGLMIATVRTVVADAFAHLGLQQLVLKSAVNNPGSMGVAARLGFRPVGTLRSHASLGPTGDPTNERADMLIHDLLPGELR